MKKDQENGFPDVGKDYKMEDIDRLSKEMWKVFNLEDRFSKGKMPV